MQSDRVVPPLDEAEARYPRLGLGDEAATVEQFPFQRG
jgi:hypothetical protein